MTPMDVIRVHVLRVFDPPAEIRRIAVGFEDRLVGVQHFLVGTVADGVGRELVVVGEGDPSCLRVVVPVRSGQARRGQVLVGLQQPGAVGTERTVYGSLD